MNSWCNLKIRNRRKILNYHAFKINWCMTNLYLIRQLQKSQARAITHNTKQKEKRAKQKKKHSDAKTRDDNSVSKNMREKG